MLSPTATVSQVSLLLYKLHHNLVGNRKKAYKQYAPVLSRGAKVELLQKQRRNPVYTIQSYSKLKMGKYVANLELDIVPLHMQLMKKRLSVICKGKEMSAVLAHLMNTEPFFSTTQTPILKTIRIQGNTLVEKDPGGETDAAIALRRSVVGLLEGRIPEAVNTSILVPVYKGGSRMLFSSYRDVHVLTCLLQIACAVMASQLRRRLLDEGLIHEGFGGFGKKSNPVSQAMTAWEVLSMWLKENNECYMPLPQGSSSLASHIP